MGRPFQSRRRRYYNQEERYILDPEPYVSLDPGVQKCPTPTSGQADGRTVTQREDGYTQHSNSVSAREQLSEVKLNLIISHWGWKGKDTLIWTINPRGDMPRLGILFCLKGTERIAWYSEETST